MVLRIVITGVMALTVAEQAISVRQTGKTCEYVEFAGPAEFVEIGDQRYGYAVNTSSTVLQIGGEYFLFRDETWLRASGPGGPYCRPEQLPPELRSAPPVQ